MITAEDFYKVTCAIVPLYFAMLVAYASVKWCKIFTPEQCSGINRFVAVFAVPVLSFHFISQNNPYQMDTKFILADTFSKLLVLALLSLWAIFFKAGGLDWLITLFSLATLPNTLVMGIPLLKAMYGDFTQSLMVQSHSISGRYTLLLFLFEYRAATLLIQTQFPGPTAAAITKFEIDDDVISLDGRNPLCTESETDDNGRIRVRIRRSTSSVPGSSALSSSMGLTPRPSNLSNAEIFSINTPHHANHDFTLGHGDVAFGYRSASPQFSTGYASSDAYSLQPTPRASTFNEMDTTTVATTANRSPVARQKEISFRDCTKIPMPEEADTKAAATNQEMPSALVMLRLILIMVGRKLSRNPNTYSSVLGLVGCGDAEFGEIFHKNNIDAGLGMAMFSLGLFMALQPRIIACGTKRATMGMGIRFICGPLLMSAASVATGLRGVKLHAAIVQAALPQGIVPFVFAREYGLHPDILST
ncbi:Auxin efflux carrier family protein, partial [Prunus dulcis]